MTLTHLLNIIKTAIESRNAVTPLADYAKIVERRHMASRTEQAAEFEIRCGGRIFHVHVREEYTGRPASPAPAPGGVE